MKNQNSKVNYWTKEQTVVALNLYCKIPFNRVSSNNPDIIKYSQLIGRSANSLKMKIGNFGSFDPELKIRGIVGLVNTSKLDEEVWDEYSNDWEKLAFDSELLISKFEGKDIEKTIYFDEVDFKEKDVEDKLKFVKTRVNQNFFRQTVLSSYNFSCCITGIKIPELLVASHIIPWKDRKETRVNPKNGLSLNSFHDKAFDKGLITITPELNVKVSQVIYNNYDDNSIKWLKQYDNYAIIKPDRFIPDIDFLKYHNEYIFRK